MVWDWNQRLERTLRNFRMVGYQRVLVPVRVVGVLVPFRC
jgi:hypothetical protein